MAGPDGTMVGSIIITEAIYLTTDPRSRYKSDDPATL